MGTRDLVGVDCLGYLMSASTHCFASAKAFQLGLTFKRWLKKPDLIGCLHSAKDLPVKITAESNMTKLRKRHHRKSTA